MTREPIAQTLAELLRASHAANARAKTAARRVIEKMIILGLIEDDELQELRSAEQVAVGALEKFDAALWRVVQ